MIKLSLRITWPAAILILVAILIWLARSSAPAQPKPQPAQRPEPRRKYRQPPADRWPRSKYASKPRREAEPFIIIDQRADGSDHAPDLDRMTYEEALHDPTLTSEQVDAIANRELREAVQDGFEAAQDSFTQTVNQFKARSYSRR